MSLQDLKWVNLSLTNVQKNILLLFFVFQAAIRNAEVEKSKAEARLAKLREGGISVDEYIDAFVYTTEQVIFKQIY